MSRTIFENEQRGRETLFTVTMNHKVCHTEHSEGSYVSIHLRFLDKLAMTVRLVIQDSKRI